MCTKQKICHQFGASRVLSHEFECRSTVEDFFHFLTVIAENYSYLFVFLLIS